MARRIKATRGTKEYVLCVMPYKGGAWDARFKFHAVDDRDALSKAYGWARSHGMVRDDVGALPVSEKTPTNLEFHDEWIRD